MGIRLLRQICPRELLTAHGRRQVREGWTWLVCDMRNAFSHHGGGFDVVICCDNSIPHLLDDSNIATALGQMLACLRPGGGCIVTVRDYDREPGKCLLKPVQCSTRDDVRHIVTQVWDFDDDGTHYNFAMYVPKNGSPAESLRRVRCTRATTPSAPKSLWRSSKGLGSRGQRDLMRRSTSPC